jgi:VanZ family protein
MWLLCLREACETRDAGRLVVALKEIVLDYGPSAHLLKRVIPARAAARWRAPILVLWAVLICCVVAGSLAPASSSLMVAIGRLHVWDKPQHFGAYLVLSFLPVIGFRDRRRGMAAALSMFALGALLEAGQHLSPGRAVELGDVACAARLSRQLDFPPL